jgi:Gas vesicle synthesis protein GvpL/GvpF
VIYVYAATEAPGPPLPEEGLKSVTRGPLAAVYEPAPSGAPEPTREALWHHEQVVEDLMREAPVLPMRFGTVLAGEDALAGVLESRGDELAAALERVRGRVELGVRTVLRTRRLESAPGGGERSGREYMLARARAYAGAESLAQDIHRPLAELAREAKRRETPPPTILKASYLVDEATVDRFRDEVRRLQEAHQDLALLCTGPWPPYSFAERP